MSDTAEVTLYYAPGTVAALSLMILLEEKGIQYTAKAEMDEDNPSDEVKKLDPRQEVPILQHGEVVLTEYLAALIYLEETFGGTKLIPDDDLTKEALVLQRMFSAEHVGLDDTTICSYWEDWEEYEEEEDEEFNEEEFENDEELEAAYEEADEEDAMEDLAEELMVWEEYLKEEGGPYIAGTEFTMADVAFFPVLSFVMWMGFKPEATYPELHKYYEALRERPTIQTAWPEDWNTPAPGKPFQYLDEHLEDEEGEGKEGE
ncbi:PREDICTED: glutathione S-transferase A-like [Branchiostoma belcheri]|uniref:Glutathione S-transferase A-like n=1 Tax=Branchiostoma belcheri TaxID=7741 RepID=A0A6P4ZEU9_BRABE|nr:PREDICTED: glutathione S-transferase A-like [Branchiostoma belcheri]